MRAAAAAAIEDARMVQIVFAVVIFTTVLWAAFGYNRLVALRNRCRNAWSQVDIQLERRHGLISKLAGVVQRYAAHERDTLQRLAEARTKAVRAVTVFERGNAECALSGALSGVYAVVEAYPDLMAHRSFLRLQEELRDTEERIRFARQFYNDTVLRYNTRLAVFPDIIIARLFRLQQGGYFDLGSS